MEPPSLRRLRMLLQKLWWTMLADLDAASLEDQDADAQDVASLEVAFEEPADGSTTFENGNPVEDETFSTAAQDQEGPPEGEEVEGTETEAKRPEESTGVSSGREADEPNIEREVLVTDEPLVPH
ncbi:unnamed protein product, partial [Amoebophrya sp. A25]|eukprot:GSA25T00026540001.1